MVSWKKELVPAVKSEQEGLQQVQSRCSGRGESPCQFATCMNNMETIAEIIALCTSVKILQYNEILVNRPHDVVNRSLISCSGCPLGIA